MKLFLDWSSYENSGTGDAYADIPKQGGDFAKAVAVCIGSRLCEQAAKCWSLPFNAIPAVGSIKSVRKLLKQVPDLQFELIESSCCGMAGNFGVEAEHFDQSQAMAELALFPALRAEPGAVLVSNGFSCQQQIGNAGFVKPLHLAELLCLAITPEGS